MNAAGNVAGLMPHPERASEAILGSEDGVRHRPLAGGQRGDAAANGTAVRVGAGAAMTVAARPGRSRSIAGSA